MTDPLPDPRRSPGRPPAPTAGAGSLLRFAAGPSLAVGLLLLAPLGLSAQQVHGTAVEAQGGQPVSQAFVSLVDVNGDRAIDETLTEADGAFRLAALAPGTYRLRVERIGYATWVSDPFTLRRGETETRRLEVPVRAVDVSELRVAVESRCGPREGAGERLLAAWEEVRKALDVARWTHEPNRVRYELRVWERRMDARGRRVRGERDETAWKTGEVSFASLAPEDLAGGGYVRRRGEGWQFYAPDAATLLSDSFREEHCFRLVPGEGETEGLVGLAFEPTDLTDPDVEGTLWLDPATSELRHMEFEYVGVELVDYPSDRKATGRVEYRRLPPGIWLVSRWRIRMPELGRRDRGIVRPDAVMERGPGILERGGEITRLERPDGEPLAVTERGTVAGRIGDQLTGGPLAHATVSLAGTEHETATDAAGRFRLDVLPPGTYRLEVRHPDPRLGGLTAPLQQVEVEGGETASLWVDFPTAWAAERLCEARSDDEATDGGPPPSEGGSALLGRVVSPADSGVAGAVVWLAAAEGEPRAFEADSTGTFLLCGLEPGRVALQASAEGLVSDTVRTDLAEGALALQDLELSATVIAGAEGGDPTVTALRGTVRSAETGEPMSGARVAILGTDLERVTGEDGTFFIPGVPRGTHRLITEHLGTASDTVEVDMTRGTVQVAVLTLDTRPIPLPTLDVEIERTFANPRLAGFYERMDRGIGDFITKEEIEARDLIANFRRIPGVRVDQCTVSYETAEAGGNIARRRTNCWDIKLSRGVNAGDLAPGGSTACPPLVYLDGRLVSAPTTDAVIGQSPAAENAFSIMQRYPRQGIEGIEVYRSAVGAPAQYRMMGDQCGIILIWTRGR